MNQYRQQIFSLIYSRLNPLGPLNNALDFGSGDGWFTNMFATEGLVKNVVAIDVKHLLHAQIVPLIYKGDKLPFEDKLFDLVYSIDSLHHCNNPKNSLKELARCSKKYILIKDHTYETFSDWLALCALDIKGNWGTGVECFYNYQHRFEWLNSLEQEDFKLEWFIYPMQCCSGLIGSLTKGFQFMGLWTPLIR